MCGFMFSLERVKAFQTEWFWMTERSPVRAVVLRELGQVRRGR